MGRPRKSPSMSDGKREIIARLIEEYDIRSAEDIQNALRDLLGRTIQGMMEEEMETQKKEKQEEDPAYTDPRNGYKTKTLRSNYGPVEVNVPQDRKSDYDPKIVPKYGRDISEIDEKIIRMYARGMTTRQISDQIMEIYGFEVSEAMVTFVIRNEQDPAGDRGVAETPVERRVSHRVHRRNRLQCPERRHHLQARCLCDPRGQ